MSVDSGEKLTANETHMTMMTKMRAFGNDVIVMLLGQYTYIYLFIYIQDWTNWQLINKSSLLRQSI